MFESEICKEIINVSTLGAKQLKLEKVEKILVCISPFFNFDKQLIQSYFDMVTENSILCGAKIEFIVDERITNCKKVYVKNLRGV